jgi:pro-kumamolisin-like protein/putative Ig domain-containing protein/subtilase family protein
VPAATRKLSARRGPFSSAVAVCPIIAAVLAVLAPASTQAAGRTTRAAGGAAHAGEVRIGAAPAFPSGATPLAAVAAELPMRITVVLEPRHAAALAAYATAVSTPGSLRYHDYITPRRFAREFGAGRATIVAVERSLRAHGLRPAAASPNGLSIPVSSTSAAVERAFSLSLARIALANGRDAVINTSAPAVDSGIAHAVQAVIGLSSEYRPEPTRFDGATRLAGSIHGGRRTPARKAQVATGGPQPCAAASAAASQQQAYTTDQIASAYEFSGLYGAGDEGEGVTVAIYELEPDDPADIAAYQSCYGTHTTVSYVPVDGGAGTGAGSGEAALDIEQVIGLAPKVHLLVYQGPNSNSDSPGSGPYDLYSAIIGQDAAQVVSNSWGECEPAEGQTDASAENVLFQEAAVQGQSIVSAAGDDGSEDCDGPPPSVPDTQLAVDDPASQPFVTGVGGTSLKTTGPPPSETVWNNGGNLGGLLGVEPGAGGGGVSSLWPMPTYQTDAPAALQVIEKGDSTGSLCHASAGYCREVPDVSADADPLTGYTMYYNGSGSVAGTASGWQGTGGTSGAGPLWAAVFALTDASKACDGTSIGFANPALYDAAAAAEASYFHDITTGNNDFTDSYGGHYFAAGPDYDMASGLGSPNAAALAGALCVRTVRIADPGAQHTFVGTRVSLALHAAGSDLRYTVAKLPAGLSLNASTGRITGRPRRAGTSAVTVDVLAAGGAKRAVAFTWTVDTRPHVAHASLTSVAAGHPALTLTIAAGHDEPALHAVRITLPAGLSFAGTRAVSARIVGRRVAETATLARRALTVVLASPRSTFTVNVAYASLKASSGLAARVARGARPRLRVLVTAGDSGGQSASVPVLVTPRS